MARIKVLVERLLWKGHLYLGLFLIVGVWVFSLSGLLLEHSRWEITQFWKNRYHTVEMKEFTPLTATDDNGRALELVARLGLTGEPDQVRSFPGGDSLGLTVGRPGTVYQVMAWPSRGLASVEINRTNGIGMLTMLHKFTGAQAGRIDNRRHWLLTRLWSLSIDITSLGLVLIVFSGLYFSLTRREDLGLKVFFFGLGIACMTFFYVGFNWLH